MKYLIALMLTAVFAGFAAADDLRGTLRVIDGDTVDIGQVRVRIFGIDAPEMDQSCENQAGDTWSCGLWVTAQLRSEFEGRQANCETIDIDRYGRVVGRCFVDGVDIARQLVQNGLAFAYRKYSMDYDFDEKAAAIAGRGLHASKVQAPSAHRKARIKVQAPPADGCVVKGNISSRGAHIFHTPGQRDYTLTKINTAQGERWFCSAQDARQAGWRAARR